MESTFVDWCNNRVTIDVLGALARARDVTLHAFLGLARAVARGDFGRVSFGVGRPEPEELLGEFAILVDVDDVGKMLGLSGYSTGTSGALYDFVVPLRR